MWDCEAYGPEAPVGVLCFVAQAGERRCAHLDECSEVMAAQRRRIFQRFNELAARGDAVGIFLAEEFATPEQLLSGDEDHDH